VPQREGATLSSGALRRECLLAAAPTERRRSGGLMPSALEHELHNAHREWNSENNLYRDEVRIWRYELYNMKTELSRLNVALDCHENCLAEHARGIREYARAISADEHIVAACPSATPCEDVPLLCSRIAHEEQTHLKHADQHELLKQHHFEVLKRWRALVKSLNQCEILPPG
jgi:hypothetical protein